MSLVSAQATSGPAANTAWLIQPLFSWCRPSAIIGLVIAVAIDAIDRVLRRWARTHIGMERIEGFAPLLTNRNAATAIPSEIFVFRGATATIVHSEPNPPFTAFRSTVSRRSLSRCFDAQAPTRCSCAALDVSPLSRHDVPAIASTMHIRMFRVWAADKFDDSQSVMSIARMRLRLREAVARTLSTPAPAGLRMLTDELVAGYGDFFSALTAAAPRHAARWFDAMQNSETREGLTGQIFEWRHSPHFTLIGAN